LLLALFTIAILAASASAQTCLKDQYGKNVQCTANDVRVAFADNIRALDGTSLTSCTAGSTFSFVADFHVVTTATARENIGLYFQTAGGANALTGTCSDNIIAPRHASANPLDTVQLGSSDYFENTSVDSAGDNCGDITTAHNNQTVTVEVDNVLCQAATGTNQLRLPDCTSWQQPGGTILCQSSPPSYPWVAAAIPGSPSKCNCDNGFTVPIQVQSPSVSVAKSCTTSISTQTNPPLTSCDAGEEGGSVTYTVTVTNNSNFGSVVVDQICDNVYGTVFRAGSPFSGPACATAGSIPAANTTCSALTVASTPQSCTFTVTQAENKTVKNMVSVSGHGSSSGTFGPSTSNEVTVVSSDAPSTATTTKSFVGNTNACFTVRYGVAVHNSSGGDETLTLSALSDDQFASITSLHGNAGLNNSVLGTTCGVANGLGTLAGTGNGAGAFNQTLAVGGTDYSCQFDGVICATPGVVAGTNCTSGIQHTNLVTPVLAGDDTPPETVSNTGGSLTVTECIATSSQ